MTSTRTEPKLQNTSAKPVTEGVYAQLSRVLYSTKILVEASGKALLNPSLRKPFLQGQIYSEIPHIYAVTPLGHTEFNEESAKNLERAAASKPYGMATCWYGPFAVLYVTSTKTRHATVREEWVGVVNPASRKFIEWLSGGNQVMTSFPGYQSVNSDPYKEQRRFLQNRFHGGATKHLSRIKSDVSQFLRLYSEEHGHQSRPLRSILNAMILNTSSYLLGLTDNTLDKIYLENPSFQQAINEVALYGVAKSYDPEMEKVILQVFIEVVKTNFTKILNDTKDDNIIRNIFASFNIEFPDEFEQLFTIPPTDLHYIAMSFAATGLGGMVHSTTNTLDWALSSLLKDPGKLNEFTDLMNQNKNLDLSNPNVFDKLGPLFPICEWVLQTVYKYPPFSHEFFYNQESFTAQIDNELIVEVPPNSYTIVNYMACNASNANDPEYWKEKFSENLAEKSTVGSFIMNKKVSSFGGSLLEKEKTISTDQGDVTLPANRKTRVCPGAMTSLYEQMIMIALILRDYSLRLGNSAELSLDTERTFPLCVRKNNGEISLTSKLTPKYAQLMQLNGIFNEMNKGVRQLNEIRPSHISTLRAG